MSTDTQQQQQQEESAAFEQAFAETSGTEFVAPAATADATTATDDAGQVQDDGVGVADLGTSPPEGGAGDAGVQVLEQQLFAGYTESELKALLGRVAEVDSLKESLRKAHGHIGELKSRQQSAPATAPVPPAAPELPAELKHVEEDYPDIAAYFKTQIDLRMQQIQQAAPQQTEQQPVATGTPSDAAALSPLEIELVVMDRMHAGWRDKVQSQDFQLWLATQNEQVRQTYAVSESADELGGVLGQYDQWTMARQAQVARSVKAQQRLANAVTPSGNAPKAQAAITEQDAFEAAFKATMGQ